jgi:hypothetical protein
LLTAIFERESGRISGDFWDDLMRQNLRDEEPVEYMVL